MSELPESVQALIWQALARTLEAKAGQPCTICRWPQDKRDKLICDINGAGTGKNPGIAQVALNNKISAIKASNRYD